MTLEVRTVDRADVDAFTRTELLAFGMVADADALARCAESFQPDFALAVYDQNQIVATASAYPLELTLPAGPGRPCPVVAVPGVTAVGVAPTHRRRGLLTTMMDHQLADLRARGYQVSILLSSESIIYGRFGYGWATSYQSVVIESDRDTFRPDAPSGGRIRMVEGDEAAKLLPEIHDRVRRCRPGEVNREGRWWTRHLKDRGNEHPGYEGRFYAIHESGSGEADGWVSYRFQENHWDLDENRNVVINDLVASDPAALAVLWRFALDLDLVNDVSAPLRPVDEALRWMLADPRRLRTTQVADHLWVRILDVAGALSSRGYGASERLVLDVSSPDPTAAGRFVLETGPDAATCRVARHEEPADLILGLADLGTIYLGGLAPSVLAAAGRLGELRAGALAAADRAFSSPVAPFCSRGF